MHWKCCLVYRDDIIIYAKSVEQHLKKLEEMFSCMRAAGLKVKRSKCQLFRDSVTFLGHTVSGQGIGPDQSNVKKVKNFPTQRDTSEVQSFLCLVRYYRKFIRNFAAVAEPLHHLLHKDIKYVRTEKCDAAFRRLRASLVSRPVLAYPNFTETF